MRQIDISFLLVKIMSKMRDLLLANAERIKKLKEAILIPAELYETRLNFCSSCEHLYKPTFSCKKCGCFMKAKAKLPDNKCPVGKW